MSEPCPHCGSGSKIHPVSAQACADYETGRVAELEAALQQREEQTAQVMRYLGELLHSRWPNLNLLDDVYGRIMQVDNGFAVGLKECEKQLQQREAEIRRFLETKSQPTEGKT